MNQKWAEGEATVGWIKELDQNSWTGSGTGRFNRTGPAKVT
jgi:hypothetical protein